MPDLLSTTRVERCLRMILGWVLLSEPTTLLAWPSREAQQEAAQEMWYSSLRDSVADMHLDSTLLALLDVMHSSISCCNCLVAPESCRESLALGGASLI